jgi:hypothetical protein
VPEIPRAAAPAWLLAALAAGIALSTSAAVALSARAMVLSAAALFVAALAAAAGSARRVHSVPLTHRPRPPAAARIACLAATLLCGALLAQEGRGECAPLHWLAGGSIAAPPGLARASLTGLAARWDGRSARLAGWCRRDIASVMTGSFRES